MAAGLPVVVSNWNGYRDTIIDGKTGYLIETNFEPGWNNAKIKLSTNNKSLDHISTVISSQIQVNVIAAGAALAKLAESPTMAIAMGLLANKEYVTIMTGLLSSRGIDMLDNLKFRLEKAAISG